MASQTYNSSTVLGYPIPPSSATLPPRRGWWSRPKVTIPTEHDRKLTCKDCAVFTPCFGGIFTFIAVLVIIHFVDYAICNAKFTIQTIAVSPSSATWHIDFLVKNPSSRYSIYYGGDETAVSLGSLNAAVLNTSHKSNSSSHTAFSVDFVAEDSPNDIEQLDIKLRANHKIFGQKFDDAEYIDIRCPNLTRSHENVEKIQCYSSFTGLKILRRNRYDN